MKFLDVELERIYQGFQLGEASALERAAVECERLSTAIDNAGKTYKRDTTSTHCALAIRALAQEDAGCALGAAIGATMTTALAADKETPWTN